MISIVFMGTCQLAAVEQVMAKHLAPQYGFRTRFVESWSALSPEDRDRLRAADIVFGQRLRHADKSDIEDLSLRAKKIEVPFLSNAFLWPFAGAAHPKNAEYPFFRYGPYPAETGDKYLNRLIAQGVDPEAAVARYLDLDPRTAVDLDRFRELILQRQQLLDEVTGFRMAPHVEGYQTRQIFRTPYHFDTAVLIELTCQIVEKLGMGAEAVDLVRTRVTANPMLDVWLPIHPAIARHFALRYGDEGQRYPFFGEGAFTFAEYAHRYMTFTWNRPLHEGIHLSLAGQDAAAVPKLRQGLAVSPGCARGHLQLGESLERCGEIEAAAASALRAAELAPSDARARRTCGRLWFLAGCPDRAIAETRSAVALDSTDANALAFLSWLVLSRNQAEEAVQLAAAAVEIAPHSAQFAVPLGNALLAAGRVTEAYEEFRRATEIDRSLAAAHVGLCQSLVRASRYDEALAAICDALAIEPNNPDYVLLSAEIWARQSRPAEAEAAHRRAIALAPTRAELHASLANFLAMEGRLDDALPAAEQALKLAGENSQLKELHDYLVNAKALEG